MSLNNLSANIVNMTRSLPPRPTIVTLATSLLSLTEFKDWLKLFLSGTIFETCRRVTFRAWHNIVHSVWATVEFEEKSESYSEHLHIPVAPAWTFDPRRGAARVSGTDYAADWMMVWLSQHPAWVKSKNVAVSTSSFGLETTDRDGSTKSNPKVRFVVAYGWASSFWHRRRYIKAIRTKTENILGPPTRTLHLSILGGSHKIIQEILAEAKECWKKAREKQVSVYASNIRNEWRLITTRPKRPLKSVVLDPGVKKTILEDALNFLDSKEWYLERGIPFRRGYLLYGAPGSGKTSLIQSIAGELNLDVYIISFSRFGLDDNSLQELISDIPEHCIALMEDIDAAFHHTLNRDDEGEGSESAGPHRSSRISLSGLLNALDGVGAQEGRLLFATTNRYEALDPSLRRAGRMDVHIEFGLASRYQIGELFRRFYLPTPRTSTVLRSPSQDTTTLKDGNRSHNGPNSGYGALVEFETEELTDVDLPTEAQDQSLATIARQMKSDIRLSPEKLDVLVDRFRELVPENKFSMAAMQGYLLMHKNQPYRAVEYVGKWVEEEMAKERPRETLAKETNGTCVNVTT